MNLVVAPQISTLVPAGGISKTYVAPWGWYTRYMLRTYLVQVFVVALGLVTLALSIDLSPQISKLMAAKQGSGTVATVARVAWLAALRAADLMPRFLSFAAFLGVLWVELSHTLSRERIVVWNTGRSPTQCLPPILLLGLILGVLQCACDFYLRPAAMAAQISQRLGSYGERYSRDMADTGTWLSAGNDLVFARIQYGPPPALHQVTVYRMDGAGRLHEVDNAETATPAAVGKTWILGRGNYWSATSAATQDGDAVPELLGSQSERSNFEAREIPLRLDPARLSTLGISPIFLPQDVLRTVARSDDGAFVGNFQTWIQVRYGHTLLPGLMALLAGCMSILLLAYEVRAKALLTILLTGYFADLAARVFLLLGEQGYVPPVVAGWTVPVLLVATLAGLLWRGKARAGR